VSIVYGRFTDAELEKRGSDPFVWEGGRRFRISELVRRMDGGANYQAKEDDAMPVVPEDVGRFEPEPEPPPEPGTYEPAQVEVPPMGPPLKDWAKDNGWRGKGPISQFIRAKYIEEFGQAAYEWQRA